MVDKVSSKDVIAEDELRMDIAAQLYQLRLTLENTIETVRKIQTNFDILMKRINEE